MSSRNMLSLQDVGSNASKDSIIRLSFLSKSLPLFVCFRLCTVKPLGSLHVSFSAWTLLLFAGLLLVWTYSSSLPAGDKLFNYGLPPVFFRVMCTAVFSTVAFPTTMCDRPRTGVETPMPRYNNHFFVALTFVARGGKTSKAKLKTVVKFLKNKYGMNCKK